MGAAQELRSAARNLLEKEILARFPPGIAREAWLRWLDECWRAGTAIPTPTFRAQSDNSNNDDLF
jgi:hypothetical protein